MRAWLISLWLACAGLGSLPLQAEPARLPEQIRVVSDVWDGHTNPDGTGLAWDLLRKVFEPAGVRLQYESVPYTRSVGLVQRGQADAWVGAYRDEVDNAVFPRWYYDTDTIHALGLASSPQPTLATLGVYRLVWVRGYDFQDQLPNATNYHEIQRRDGILEMLRTGRADFYIDAIGEVNFVRNKDPHPEQFQITQLVLLPLFIGFAPNERGRALAALFDQRMDTLVPSGALRPLFKQWKQPYPFDQELPDYHVAP